MTVGASNSSSFSYQWTYDIFINFRGEDTRYGFTGNLYKALCENGIRTFIDDEELQKGADITPTLLNAIEQSRMAIVVFSKNYASSTFCLDELVKIIRSIEGNNRLLCPIFYDVDPSDVRHQKGHYGEALAMHLKTFKADEEKVKSWKWALQNAANNSGLHFRHDQYEYQLIERIVQEMSSKISRHPLHIAEYPVGLDSRVSEIKSLLRLGSNDEVNMVGICGIGGMGKTTIARAVYNSIADHFEGVCFLHDIKENSRKLGLEQMQERMLSKILRVNIKVEDVNEGIPIIKRRFNQKKVLLILDNVDKREQFEKLSGECNWFGFGSRIIITTRDKQLLARHGVDQICEVKGFNYEESLHLLKWNVFKHKEFDPSFNEVLDCVVHYAQGLPLALQVIGSHLFGMSIHQCKAAIDKYRRIPNEDIQQILKVSYNSLTEIEQEIFLDIACFFRGAELEYVENMVKHAHDFDPSYSIGVLINKYLIKIEYNRIRMHDLIQDMGREIVRQESPREPGERSRLWFHMDILHVLQNNTGSNKINAVIVEYWPKGEVNWDGEALKRMKNLKILIFKRIRFSEVPKYLPNSLRVLYWWGYPASCLPVDFHPRNLVELDLPNSCLQSIIMGQAKRFENLSVLNLSECSFITQISDISGIPNLTELCLKNCENLIKIDDSVGYLRKLQRLDAYDCENLRHFPRCLKLPTLEDLSLTGCSSLRKFPEIQEKMECITSLDLSRTNLGLPFSIRNLTALEEIIMEDYGRGLHLSSSISLLPEPKDTNIEGCQAQECPEMSSILFPNMEEIVLNRCNISDGFLPICLTWFVNVKHLDLRRSNFMILPACIKECLYLKSLDLSDCMHLREVRGIPPNIEQLYAMNCISLNSESRSLLMSQELHDTGSKKFWVSGSTMPRWVSHHTLSLWFRDQIPTISFCCVLRKHLHHHSIFDKLLIDVVINGDKIKMCDDFLFYPHSNMLVEDVVVLVRIICCGDDKVSLASEWNHVEVKAKTIYGSHYASKKETCVEEVGIYVKELKHRREDIQFINPHKRKKLFHDFNLGSSFMASRRTHDITSNKVSLDTYANSQEGVGDGAPIESLKLTCKRDGQFTSTSELKYEIAKVAYQGRLVDCEGAERFIQLMQRHNHNTDQSDLHARFLLLQVIKDSLAHCHEKTNEEDADFNCKFHVLFIKALPLLNKWLQDILKGKFHNIENDELVKRFLSASLEAMYKMVPVSLYQLQSFGVVKSVKLLLKHKSPHIWLKAESLINRWKFHLDAEEENSLASLLEEDPELSKTEIGGEKLKDDANHASSSSMSNAIVSRVVHVGERAIDSSNSQSKQDEAVTNEIDILLEKVTLQYGKLTLSADSSDG